MLLTGVRARMSGCNGITPAAESGIHEAALWLFIEHGITTSYIEVGGTDSLGMLMHQVAFSWDAWTGQPAPLSAMWDAVRGTCG